MVDRAAVINRCLFFENEKSKCKDGAVGKKAGKETVSKQVVGKGRIKQRGKAGGRSGSTHTPSGARKGMMKRTLAIFFCCRLCAILLTQ